MISRDVKRKGVLIMSRWRLLKDDIHEPKMHFAVEETLLRRVSEGSSPNTLRLRKTSPSVWIGLYQDPEEEVDLEFCKENGIPVVRRPNPGGAVYQDEGTFCYSLFFQKKELFERLDIEDSDQLYDILGQAVVDTCAEYGVNAETSGINDVVTGGRKIYGSAQIEWYSGIVHSGTFLVNVNKHRLNKTLTPSSLKFKDKKSDSLEHRVVNLDELVSRTVEVDEVMEHLADNISQRLGIEFEKGGLGDDEIREAREIYQKKYSLEDWTYKKPEARSTTLSTKGESGIVTLSVDMEGGIIKEVTIKGDFMVADQHELDKVLKGLKDQTVSTSLGLIERSKLEGHLKKDMIRLLKRMVKRND